MVVTWKTRNIRSLFPLKDENDYKSCVIFKGVCSCGDDGLYDHRKAFCKVKIVFIHPLYI